MLDDLNAKLFKVNVTVNIENLKCHESFFRAITDSVIDRWLRDEAANKMIVKYMPIDMFRSEYAFNIYEYFLNVISGEVKLGNCPTVKKFLAYCSDKSVAPDELFLICSGLRKSIIGVVFDEPFMSVELFEEINLITDQNFAGVMSIYSTMIQENEKKILQNNRLLQERSFFDDMTGLKNIRSLQHDLDIEEPSVLMVININRLHEINESYGYEAGDMIILQLADMISELYVTATTQVYRANGDEFAVLMKKDPNKLIDMEQLARSFQEALIPKTFMISDYEDLPEVPIQVSIGVSDLPYLLINAFSALHEAKLYDKPYVVRTTLHTDTDSQIKNIQHLYEAIQSARIITYFQPIVDNKTKQISKYETLVRMLDENNQPISPFFFLNAAKKARLYPLLTKIIIEQAFSMFHNTEQQFSINIEKDDLTNSETRDYIIKMLDMYSDPSKIIFEIVESEIIEEDPKVTEFLSTLREKGCQLAIDDFGSGFSNFEYLLRIKANIIKIDGSLVKDIDTNKEKLAIVKSIVSFANDIGLETVAEYVSNEAIYNLVKEMGVTYSQGFLFGRPLPTIQY